MPAEMASQHELNARMARSCRLQLLRQITLDMAARQ
jgi:hypothetical protein